MRQVSISDLLRQMKDWPRLILSREKRVRRKATYELRDDVRDGITSQGLVETGDYWRSVVVMGDSVTTDRPDAMRHEFGFVGIDALGRHYNEPPREHWRPAIDRMRKAYPEAITKEIKTIVNEG